MDNLEDPVKLWQFIEVVHRKLDKCNYCDTCDECKIF